MNSEPHDVEKQASAIAHEYFCVSPVAIRLALNNCRRVLGPFRMNYG